MSHLNHLRKDLKLKKIIASQDPVVLQKEKNIYLWICFSIISQQLSTKVAAVIQKRFLDLYKKKKPSLQDIVGTDFTTLKNIGLSESKTNYIFNVCRFFIEQKLTDAKLFKMQDDELKEMLIQIKGVGKWTVEMILMFAMEREDVFAVDDLGIQQQMCKLYSIDSTDKKQMKIKMEEIASGWSPYRTYACRYLWAWKDSK